MQKMYKNRVDDRVIKLVENINRFVRNEEPLNKVNLDTGY